MIRAVSRQREVYLDMDHLLVLLLLWSSGVRAEEKNNSAASDVRLVGEASRCAGNLEVKHQGEWRPMDFTNWTLETASAFCSYLDCGSAVSLQTRADSSSKSKLSWSVNKDCVQSAFNLKDCVTSGFTSAFLYLTCSAFDDVRLVGGAGRCAGTLEVKHLGEWKPVDFTDWTLETAAVFCAHLDCGSAVFKEKIIDSESYRPVWEITADCVQSRSSLRECVTSKESFHITKINCSDPVRLEVGASRCDGILEVKHLGEWRTVDRSDWTLKETAVFCEHLDCGSAVFVQRRVGSYSGWSWSINKDCVQSASDLRDCVTSVFSSSFLHLTCSGSVRLLNGSSLCSGRLEVKSDHSWSSVCEADFDQQDAEVVCRELGCGPPSVLQGALYGEVEAPVWSREFQCGGHESTLLSCRSSESARTSCSPAKAVGLTCSEPVRLVGGASRCAGTLEVKHLGEWRSAGGSFWTLKETAVFCEHLDCGSMVSVQQSYDSSSKMSLFFDKDCVQSAFDLRDCVKSLPFAKRPLQLTCSGSVRLLNGSSLCSGRLEVKSDHSWSSVCEADFDQQDAEVVCRELDCGPPSVLQGALFGEVEAPVWSREFQCGGHESTLLSCRSSESARTSCSPAKAVGLTCSDPVRLVGGASHCAGTLEVKHLGEWRSAGGSFWTLNETAVFCEHLDCGAAVSVQRRVGSNSGWSWSINKDCVQSASDLRDCVRSGFTPSFLHLTCSGSVRLLNGSSLCSGRLEVKSDNSWSSVCEADFDQQDAEVVCRELSCGPPSVLQGALYGEVEAPVWSRALQCGGHESTLLGCRSSESARTSCSPAKAVGLTCSEPDDVRLVGGASHCDGILELKHVAEWRPVDGSDWTLKETAVFCEHLDCGSAVSVQERNDSNYKPSWQLNKDCVQSAYDLRVCVISGFTPSFLHLTCSAPTGLIVRVVLLPLILLLENVVLYFYCKANRGWKSGRPERIELMDRKLCLCS